MTGALVVQRSEKYPIVKTNQRSMTKNSNILKFKRYCLPEQDVRDH